MTNTDLNTDLISGAAGKTAFVTGAGGGIGRAVVRRFLAAGVKVAAADITNLEDPAAGYWPLKTDCTDPRQVKASVGAAVHRFGGIDLLVHAVGVVGEGPLIDVSLEDWERLLSINLTSAFLVTKEIHSRLNKPGASVVLFSSTNGRNGGTSLSGPAYAAAKAGILNLTRYLAKEWMSEGIRVNCLAPGPVDTPMLDRLQNGARDTLRRQLLNGEIATADQVAATVAWLCSGHAASVTGACLNVSGGLVLD